MTTSYSPSGRSSRCGLAEAEAPGLVVVRRPVRDEVGLVGQRVQVRSELVERHRAPHGHAVVDDVEIRPRKSITRLPAGSATYASRMFHSGGTVQSSTGVPDGTSCTSSGDHVRRGSSSVCADAVAGDAAADRVQPLDQIEQVVTELVRRSRGESVSRHALGTNLSRHRPRSNRRRSSVGVGRVGGRRSPSANAGHSMPSAGSSHRKPRAASGTYWAPMW